ncbi:hypothetical protein G5B40_11920 [Pikeienuella piscinae]|uniref:Uncharacterized protein n=1 Tax=Pikeienuella piscinae TaxID=2748098 RepID=A0A7L5BXE0_9RHOB|nr:hypothetical protein [Pikeienuella piscinae]QIE56101.1 hypothetical protein G5B40_11920 [Pikeienuella piscinae]
MAIYVIASIIALATAFAFDPSAYLEVLFQGMTPQMSYENLIGWVSLTLKFILVLIIFSICFWTTKRRAGPKSFTYENLADELLKLRKKHVKIELIGYSLGFANPIKFRLEDRPWNDLDVTIYTMKRDAIIANFHEQKSLDHRVDVISERLGEWRALRDQGNIGSLKDVEVSELMPFAAIVIDGDRLFVSNYKWKTKDGRLGLQKLPAPERLFFEISNVDGAYETVMAVIKTFRRHVG